MFGFAVHVVYALQEGHEPEDGMPERRQRHTAAHRLQAIDREIAQILRAFPDLSVYRGPRRRTAAPQFRLLSRHHGPRVEPYRPLGHLKQRAH